MIGETPFVPMTMDETLNMLHACLAECPCEGVITGNMCSTCAALSCGVEQVNAQAARADAEAKRADAALAEVCLWCEMNQATRLKAEAERDELRRLLAASPATPAKEG